MTKYLLPCPCGLQVRVEAAQAGQTITCTCGAGLDVPKLRELSRLETDATESEPSGPAWGPRQGVGLVGSLLLALGLAAAGYLHVTQPDPPDYQANLPNNLAQIDGMMIDQAWAYWLQHIADRKLEVFATPANAEFREAHRWNRRWFYVALTLAGLGLIMLAGAFAARPASQGGR